MMERYGNLGVEGGQELAKFGRFDFGSDEPSEIYEGDYMNLEKGYVKILKGRPNFMDLGDEQLVAVVNLDKGQSVRRMKRGRN